MLMSASHIKNLAHSPVGLWKLWYMEFNFGMGPTRPPAEMQCFHIAQLGMSAALEIKAAAFHFYWDFERPKKG